jgi:hypothetical protein
MKSIFGHRVKVVVGKGWISQIVHANGSKTLGGMGGQLINHEGEKQKLLDTR